MATKTTTLPPISDLFRESWVTFKGSVLNLFILSLVNIGIFIGIFLIALIAALPVGIISIVSAVNSHNFGPGFATSMGIVGVILFVALIAAVIIGFAVKAATIMFVGDFKTKPHFGAVFKKGFSYIWPLFLVGLLIGLIAGGGYFLFIIPGIVLALLFSFAPYEIVLNNSGVVASMRRSMKIVLTNFWGILGRYLLWILIVILISIVPNIALSTRNSAGAFPMLSTVINVLLSWFGVCYSITLYKQASRGMDADKGGKLLWPVIIGVVGWIVGIIVLISTISLVSYLITQGIKSQSKKPTNTYNMQNVMETVYPSMIPRPSGMMRYPTGTYTR